MKTTFQIRWAAIKAAELIASHDQTRFILNGVQIEIVSDGEAVLASTDGRRLFACKENIEIIEQDGEFLGSFVIPRELIAFSKIASLTKGIKQATISVDGRRVTISCPRTGMSFAGNDLKGKYPEWRKVIPTGDLNDRIQMCVNPRYLADFYKCFAVLTEDKNPCLKFSQHDGNELNPFIITCQKEAGAFGVLMPMRESQTVKPKLPEWAKPANKENEAGKETAAA